MPSAVSRIPAALALHKAQEQNAIEAIYVDRNDFALEGTTSNLFAVIGNQLVTPGQGVLSGITRQAVLDLARDLLPIDIRELPLEELLSAREVFLTGTNKGLVPVVQVDDTQIADGKPGPHTRHIMTALEAHFEQSSEG